MKPVRLLNLGLMHHKARYFHNPGFLQYNAAMNRLYRHQNNVRCTSSVRELATDTRSLARRVKNVFLGTSIGILFVFGYYYITDTRASVHQWLVVPSLRWLYEDAEEAHEAGTKSLKALYGFGLHPRERENLDSAGDLEVEVFGHKLSNPIGISAGLDKGAEILSPLFSIGPAIVEVGGVTPFPQVGNPKPRIFRLPSQKAMINRYGLNSEGADIIAMRLRQRVREYAYKTGFGIDEFGEQMILDGEAGVPPGSLINGKLLAVQIAKNSLTPDDNVEAVKADYVYCVERLAKYADILVVNISCPNVSRQRLEPLRDILTSVVEATKKTNRKTKPAVMVKVSPDEDSDEQVSNICDAVWESGIDGVIVSNTTKRRPNPLPIGYSLSNRESALMAEQGGYSGPQLFRNTLALVKRYRTYLDDGPPLSQLTGGELRVLQPDAQKRKIILASGGIGNGRQVLEVLAAGASVAMVYTTLVYGGVGTITTIKEQLRDEMKKIGTGDHENGERGT